MAAANHRQHQLWAVRLQEGTKSKAVLKASLLQSPPNIVLNLWQNKRQSDQVVKADRGVIIPYRRTDRGNQANGFGRDRLYE